MYQNFIIPYLYEAQHVSGDTPPIIRSLKLHWHIVASCWIFLYELYLYCVVLCDISMHILLLRHEGTVSK